MENNTKTIKKIVEFIDFKGINYNKFSIAIGVSNSYFSKMVRNDASIGSDIIEKILLIYPELNPTWLLTGKGHMLTGKNTYIIKDELPSGPCQQCESKDKLLNSQTETIAALKKTNDLLESFLSTYSEGQKRKNAG